VQSALKSPRLVWNVSEPDGYEQSELYPCISGPCSSEVAQFWGQGHGELWRYSADSIHRTVPLTRRSVRVGSKVVLVSIHCRRIAMGIRRPQQRLDPCID
jgi:hypothetical protein